MIVIIFLTIIFGVLTFFFNVVRENRWKIILCGALFIACLLFCLYIGSNCNVVAEQTIPLYAGFNSQTTSGNFILGSGTIEEVDMVYYWIDENGIKSKHHVPMRLSVFIEDGKNTLVKRYATCKKGFEWAIPYNLDSVIEFEFHVPENAIMQMYQFK